MLCGESFEVYMGSAGILQSGTNIHLASGGKSLVYKDVSSTEHGQVSDDVATKVGHFPVHNEICSFECYAVRVLRCAWVRVVRKKRPSLGRWLKLTSSPPSTPKLNVG